MRALTAPCFRSQVMSGCRATLVVANLRGGRSFAVADAYRDWDDVPEDVAAGFLAGA